METMASAYPRPTGGRNSWLAFGVGALLLCALFATLTLSGSTVDTLVEEDGPVEWAGAVGLLAGGGLFLAAGVVALRRGPASGKTRLGAVVLLGVGAALLMLGGEEISWGQRLFGWGTPEAFSSANAQHETNIHNLNELQGTLIDGDRLFRIGWVTLFVLVPLVAWMVPRVRERVRSLLPVAPLWLAALFVLAWVLTHVATATLTGGWTSIYTLGSAATEIQEAAIELLMGVAALEALIEILRAP